MKTRHEGVHVWWPSASLSEMGRLDTIAIWDGNTLMQSEDA